MGKEQPVVLSDGISPHIIVCGLLGLGMDLGKQVTSATHLKETKKTRAIGMMVDSLIGYHSKTSNAMSKFLPDDIE